MVQGWPSIAHGISQAQIENALCVPDRGPKLRHVHIDRVGTGAGTLAPLTPAH
ncbi:hypothetical protein D3C86_2057290 [compost metagenome]